MNLFPDSVMKSQEMTLESIASKLTYFHIQIHMIHWQTSIYAEHMCTGDLYDYVHDFLDNVVEKIMGYTGTKPLTLKLPPTIGSASAVTVISDLKNYAKDLENFASSNNYPDIENMAQELSGHAAKSLYLLTLS